MTEELGIYLNIGTIIALIAGSGSVAWKLSRVEKSVRDDLMREVARLEHEARERGDTYRNEFGETCAAIRQKIHDVEVYSRDNFVSKDSFESWVDRLERSFEKMTERLENKFDQAVHLFHQRPD